MFDDALDLLCNCKINWFVISMRMEGFITLNELVLGDRRWKPTGLRQNVQGSEIILDKGWEAVFNNLATVFLKLSYMYTMIPINHCY